MKKAKNENLKAVKTEDSIKISEGKSIPSDKIRSKENSQQDLLFKKVLYGFDPDEVSSYISELSRTYESSLKIQEAKLSSLKEELVLANRERDLYIGKYKETQSEAAAAQTPQQDSKNDEIESVVCALERKIQQLENENKELKNNIADNKTDDSSSYISKISALETSVKALEKENSQLKAEVQKSEALRKEYNDVFSQLETARAQLAATERELNEKAVRINEDAQQINTINAENEKLKKLSAELEIKNSVLDKRAAESEEEFIRLKDENKTLVFENAEKINAIENERAKEKLAMQKELKLYGYYVDRAELTLAELSKQMEQIKQSLEETQSL